MRRLVLLVSLAVSAGVLRADPPGAMYVFPPGGQRGTTVAVHVGGLCLHEGCPFELLGPGVQGPARITLAPRTTWFEGPVIPQPESQRQEDYPRDYDASIAIAADAPLGLRRGRVWNSQGATESFRFVVGDLPEIIEQETDGEPVPTPVTLPVTINGRIFPREDVDIWTVSARAGESITCDVTAARLGSGLDPRLEVLGPDGRRIAENSDDRTVDSFLRFTAPRDGVYQIRICDESFGGLQHYVYRLTIMNGPHVNHVYPLGGRRGSRTAFACSGQKTPATPVEFSLPERGDMHLQRLDVAGTLSNPFPIELGDLPEHLEAEPNNEPNNEPNDAAPLAVPAVFNGRVNQAGDVDVWPFAGKKGESLTFDVRAARLGTKLDSVLTIVDRDGKSLATNDDLAGNESDSRLTFSPPQDGTFFAVVKDQFADRGGPEFAYRLVVSGPTPPDFQLRIPTDALTLLRGGQVQLKVAADRSGGFADAIQLAFDGLPDGVTASANAIAAKQNEVNLVFKADAGAKIQAVKVRITGSAKIGDQTVSRTAIKPASQPGDLELDHVLLAVAIPTPFKVKGVFETKFASQGSTYVRRYAIDRGGFTGPIQIRLADRQNRHLQGVTGPEIVVPAEQSEFDYPITLPPWMETGRTSRTCVMGIGEVVEPDGSRHKVCFSSQEQADQIIVIVDPTQLGVRLQPASVRLVPGQAAAIRVRIARSREMTEPARIEVVIPEHIRGISASPIELLGDQSEAVVSLKFADGDLGPLNQPLKVRATTRFKGLPYTAEAKLDVVP